jgi:endonuclease/exonuclease/phosphatase family metal-dependent hydrolase
MTDALLLGAVAPPELHVMTFNIRRRFGRLPQRSPDRWVGRAPRIAAMLRAERPALLGVQEALAGQARMLSDALGPRYRRLGRGRNADGRGEGCPLYYDADRLELLDWEQTALSETPTVPGSRSWGSALPRVLVTATLRDRATDARFIAANTHFDAFSRRARLQSAHLVRERIAAQPLPAVVMGDLNAGQRSAPVAELLRDGVLVDAWTAAARRLTPDYGTFANYRPPRPGGARIDWIAVSGGISVHRAAIDGRAIDGGWASDHLPVHAVIEVPS